VTVVSLAQPIYIQGLLEALGARLDEEVDELEVELELANVEVVEVAKIELGGVGIEELVDAVVELVILEVELVDVELGL
jgi:hypothetical protein